MPVWLEDLLLSDRGPLVFLITMTSLLLIALAVLAFAFGPVACEERWYGFDTSWSFFGGCKVLTESGYIPEGSFRVVTTP